MQEAHIESNTLMRSFVTHAIHHSFQHAIKQIGLPDFPKQTFLLELGITHHTLEHDFPDDRSSLLKLWTSIRHGEIIATEVWDEAPVFYVRGALGSLGVVLRLIYQNQEWHIESVISTYHRPLKHIRWLRSLTLTGAILLAAIVGFTFHHPTPLQVQSIPLNANLTHSPSAQSPASAQVKSKSNGTVHTAPSHTGSSSHTVANGVTLNGSTPTASNPRLIAFTVSLGMPLYNLAQFLYQQHLVASAMNFDMAMKQAGVDQSFQPGRYVFKQGMSTAQLLAVIQHGPSAAA